MDPVSNISPPNARINHIRKFCCNPPKLGRTLRLMTVRHDQTLGTWEREDCADNATIPLDVDSRLQDHTDTVEEDTEAQLAWITDAGNVVCSKTLRCRYVPQQQDGSGGIVESPAHGITGTEKGGLLQFQRAYEIGIKHNSATTITLLQILATNNRELAQQDRESREAAHRAHIEMDKMRLAHRLEMDKLYSELWGVQAQAAQEPAGGEDESTKAELMKQVIKVMPIIVHGAMKMMAEKAATPAQLATTNGTPPAKQGEG